MHNKKIILLLISLLITPIILPQVSAQESIIDSAAEELRLLYFDTQTEIIIDNSSLPDYPILKNPGETLKGIEATVKFKYELPWYFPSFLLNSKIGNWIMFRDTAFDMSVNIELSIDSKPDWIDVELPEKVKIDGIGTGFKENTFEFNVTINESAMALEEGDVVIKAKFVPDDAWGLNPSEDDDKISFKSDYVGKIEAEFLNFENATEFIFKGGEKKAFPLKIKNIGNGGTIVRIQTIEPKDQGNNWNITIEQENVTLENINDVAIVNITILAKEKAEASNIITKLKLTPRSNKDESVVDNDNSIIIETLIITKEKEDDLGNILSIIGYVLLVIIIIVIVLFIILRKFSR